MPRRGGCDERRDTEAAEAGISQVCVDLTIHDPPPGSLQLAEVAVPQVFVRRGRMRAASSRARLANFRGEGLLALPPQDPHQLARRHRAGQGHPLARPMGTVPEFTDSLRGSVQRLPGVVGYRVARDFVGRSQVPEVGEEVRERPGRAARDGLPGTAIAFTIRGAGRRRTCSSCPRRIAPHRRNRRCAHG